MTSMIVYRGHPIMLDDENGDEWWKEWA